MKYAWLAGIAISCTLFFLTNNPLMVLMALGFGGTIRNGG